MAYMVLTEEDKEKRGESSLTKNEECLDWTTS